MSYLKALHQYDYSRVLIPNSIRKKSSFFSEFWSIMMFKLIPALYNPDDIRFLLNNNIKCRELNNEINACFLKDENAESQQLLLEKLRIDGIIAFNDLVSIINGEQQNVYIKSQFESLDYTSVYLSGMPEDQKKIDMIQHQLDNLEQKLIGVKKSYKDHGTNLHLTYRIEKLFNDIQQARLILSLVDPRSTSREKMICLSEIFDQYFKQRSIKNFFQLHSQVLIRIIVDHNSDSGGKYIAGNMREYLKIIIAALIGGVFIAIFSLFKFKLEEMGISLFGEGLLFGLNYAICFILVEMLGGVIATKQPAMTAGTISNLIYKNRLHRGTIRQTVNIVADVSKSQFISFLGNISVAFLLSTLMFYFLREYLDIELINPEKAKYLLSRNDITHSAAIFYAGIAGVFLSLSGFFAGYIDNITRYYKLHARFENKYYHNKFIQKIFLFIVGRLGKFSGSAMLGFLLGMAGAIGLFTGTPFDIRHVAFSGSHIAYGSMATNFDWLSKSGLIMLLSIFLIGFVNFIVSFFITFYIAFNASKKDGRKMRKLLFLSFLEFIKRPWLFILPLKFKGIK